jgi:hypothetical protein
MREEIRSAENNRKPEMSRISLAEVHDLLQKLFSERKPLATFFVAPSGTRVLLSGFIAEASKETGIFVTSLPDGRGHWINVPPFSESECIFSYGEQREIAEELRNSVSDLGESALMIDFLRTGEQFSIFFKLS